MQIRLRSWGWLGLAWAIVGATASAQGQTAGGSSGSTTPTPLSMANPYMNPYLNPYLNPAIANGRPMTGRDAAMYMYMANSANGGLGSGRLSGTRPGPMGPTGAPVNPVIAGGPGAKAGPVGSRLGLGAKRTKGKLPPGEMPNSASVPGSGAARFFNPGGGATRGAGQYFSRGDMYFNNNRR